MACRPVIPVPGSTNQGSNSHDPGSSADGYGRVTTSFPFALVANSHRITKLVDACDPLVREVNINFSRWAGSKSPSPFAKRPQPPPPEPDALGSGRRPSQLDRHGRRRSSVRARADARKAAAGSDSSRLPSIRPPVERQGSDKQAADPGLEGLDFLATMRTGQEQGWNSPTHRRGSVSNMVTKPEDAVPTKGHATKLPALV